MVEFFEDRCILSKFYIKPQLIKQGYDLVAVVSYRNSTSNHNQGRRDLHLGPLYLIEILHQTTTWTVVLFWYFVLYLIEILHQTTTVRRT